MDVSGRPDRAAVRSVVRKRQGLAHAGRDQRARRVAESRRARAAVRGRGHQRQDRRRPASPDQAEDGECRALPGDRADRAGRQPRWLAGRDLDAGQGQGALPHHDRGHARSRYRSSEHGGLSHHGARRPQRPGQSRARPPGISQRQDLDRPRQERADRLGGRRRTDAFISPRSRTCPMAKTRSNSRAGSRARRSNSCAARRTICTCPPMPRSSSRARSSRASSTTKDRSASSPALWGRSRNARWPWIKAVTHRQDPAVLRPLEPDAAVGEHHHPEPRQRRRHPAADARSCRRSGGARRLDRSDLRRAAGARHRRDHAAVSRTRQACRPRPSPTSPRSSA